ncbi:hypothetical protein QQX98_011224 [Neonectria punicea]|uniref:DUF7820 domain-containing protein n=1 Tax=Neonectria punicea TaxID=979145 RepID=A0ABR1GMP8_9HYPO
MDPSNGKGNDFERRSSLRRSLRVSSTVNGAPDDDDYDLSAMMVADGFRPTDHTTSAVVPPPTSQPQSQPEQDVPSTPTTPVTQPQQLPPIGTPLQQLASAANASPQKSDMRTRPSSISKPPRNHDSLALRNEGSGTSAAGRTHIARISSISSESPVMRVESPYRGPSGPSHPYQMYPQRTMSVATTSTTAAAAAAVIPEDSSYTGPSGPTHPYALYTQNTVPAAEPAGDPIPLGFGGMGGNYQRQLGPDGEEAGDMIGPLGHLEELPPYTRYADNAFVPKVVTTPATTTDTAPSTDVTPSTEPTSPDRIIAGAGGIGMATRDPEFSSTEDDLGMPRTRPSVRSNISETSQHDVNTAARDVAEKTPENKWQKRARKKLWGIVPYWAICLLTVGLIIMGIIMGAVIGTLLTRHKKPPKEKESSITTMTTTVEVQPFTSLPKDLAPMATGHYGLPPFKVSLEPDACFSDPSLTKAWSCSMQFSYYSMDVTVNSDGLETEGYQLAMNAIDTVNAEFIWGTKPPSFSDPITLTLVNDTFAPERGPAWWSMVTYNKTVIVSDDDFQYVSKRGWHPDDDEDEDDDDDDDEGDEHLPPPPGFKSRKGAAAKAGDEPWICTWPDVTLQIFIYPKQKSSNHFGSTTTTGYGSSTTDGYGSSTTYGSTTNYGATTTTSGSAATSTSKSGFENAPPAYPKVLKMVEQRHWSKKSAASCRKVKINEDGKSCEPVRDKDGNPVEVAIVESESTASSKLQERYIPKRWYVLDLLRRGGSFELTQCGCLWWAT